MKNVVLYIDEEPRALKINGRALQRCFGDDATVIPLEPIMIKEKMVELIFNHENLSSIIIDQKLNAAGTADYFGTELADAIRQIDKKIPVYILTNFSQELDPNNKNIEYLLSKDDLTCQEKIKTISTRVRRHLNTFNDILSERERRFDELLRKHHSTGLSEDEYKEFQEIGFYRERKILASELIDSIELERKLLEVERKLQDVRNRLGMNE